MNAYFAGASKLGAALGRDGALPAWLAHGSVAGEVPRRSLAVLTGGSAIALAVVEIANLDVRPLVLLTSAALATVYAVGVVAALRLLPAGGMARPVAVLACIAIALLLAVVGPYLIWPAVLAVVAAAFVHQRAVRLRNAVRLH
jgi:amino acid efflux transporter